MARYGIVRGAECMMSPHKALGWISAPQTNQTVPALQPELHP